MNFMTRLLSFDGRAGRSEFWAVHLATIPVQLLIIISMLLNGDATPSEQGIITLGSFSLDRFYACLVSHRDEIMFVLLVPLLPQLAVASRRLHDRDRSASWLVLFVGPMFLALILDRFEPSPDGGPSQLTLAAIFLLGWYFIELGLLDGSPGINSYTTEVPQVAAQPEPAEIEYEEPLQDYSSKRYSAALTAIDLAIAGQALATAGSASPAIERRQSDRPASDRRVGMPDTREVKVERRRGADRRESVSQGFGRRRTI